jgi:hypothetical protein
MRTLTRTVIVACLLCVTLGADEHIVLIDKDADFAAHSFTLVDIGVSSRRPELSGSPVMPSIAYAIRRTLVDRGYNERQTPSDLIVEYSLRGVDFNIGPFGRVTAIDAQPRGRRGQGASPPVAFTEATLVIDVKRASSQALMWRGVYRIAENDTQKLMDALTKNAARLVSEFPRAK